MNPTRIICALAFAFLGANLPAYAQSIDFENGIVAYFPFNGTAEDKSGTGNDGIVKGADLTKDRYGNDRSAYSFDGKTNAILIPHSTSLDFSGMAAYSISLWIRPRDENSGCVLLKNSDYGIKWDGLRKGNTLYTGTGNGFISTPERSWRTNQWYHLVLVQRVNELAFYIDGRKVFSREIAHQTSAKEDGVYIGKHPFYWGGFAGDIDDICIFDRALNEAEIEAMTQIETMPLSITPKNKLVKLPQNQLDGTWKGIFSQPGNNQFDNFAYWAKFEITGNTVHGYARIEIPRSSAYGILRLEGNLTETTLSFSEVGVIRENNPTGLDWCKKFAKLSYDPNQQALRGPWYADNCKENGEMLLSPSEEEFNFYNRQSSDNISLNELMSMLKKKQNKDASLVANTSGGSTEIETLVNRKIELDPISFETASATITGASQQYLRQNLVPVLKAAPDLRIRVSGHTDATGNAAVNLQLSINRAQAVVNFLVASGISPNQLSSEGFGEAQPIAPNTTPEGRQKNRRVEIEIIGE